MQGEDDGGSVALFVQVSDFHHIHLTVIEQCALQTESLVTSRKIQRNSFKNIGAPTLVAEFSFKGLFVALMK